METSAMASDTARGDGRVAAARRRRPMRVATLAWVTATAAATVIALELGAWQGPPAQVLANGTHGLSDVSAVALDGSHAWVANVPIVGGLLRGGELMEFSAGSGRLIRRVSGAGYGFDDPSAIAIAGGHAWVANAPQNGPRSQDTGSLTELDARTGQLNWRVSGAAYGFASPVAVTVSGGRVLVLNSPQGAAGSVSVLAAATGRVIRVIRRGIGSPAAVTSVGGQVWIASTCDGGSDGSVTELDPASGRVIRVLAGHRYGFSCPSGIAAASGRIWITNQGQAPNGGSVTVLGAADGRWLGTLSEGYYFDNPAAIAADGSAIWVTNSNFAQAGGSVTELSALSGERMQTISSGFRLSGFSDGTWLRLVIGHHYQLLNPDVIAADGTHIWILSHGDAGITILTVS